MTDPQVTPPVAVSAPQDGAREDVEQNKDIAALGYVWILSVFVYFAKKQSPFVRFHAKQGMILFALSIPLWLIPVVGRFLVLVVLAFAVIGFLNAARGLWKELPLIGALARGDKSGLRKQWRDVTDAAQSIGKNDPPKQPPPPAPSAPSA